jgi:uncharacterized protein with PQ loop repeat
MKMHFITLLGFAAGTLTTLSFVPQVHKAWRTVKPSLHVEKWVDGTKR